MERSFCEDRLGHAVVRSTNITTGNFISAVTSGNLLVAWIWYNSSTQSVGSVTDSKGNAYVRAVGPTTGTGGLAGWRQELWYAKNVIGGTGVAVTATFPGSFSAEKAIIAHEYSGLDRVSPVDAAVATVSSSANASSTLATLSASRGLIFGAALFQTAGSSGSGFTRRSSLQSNVSEDRVVSAGGLYAATFSNTAQSSIIQMILFK